MPIPPRPGARSHAISKMLGLLRQDFGDSVYRSSASDRFSTWGVCHVGGVVLFRCDDAGSLRVGRIWLHATAAGMHITGLCTWESDVMERALVTLARV